MSWSTRIGALTPSTLVDGVKAEKYIPENIKKAICDAAANLPNTPNQVLVVETSGHLDDTYGGHAEFDVKRIDLASEPQAVIPPPAPAEPASPPPAAA